MSDAQSTREKFYEFLQLDPSLGRASQVPGCSFRARRPTLPRKVPVGFVSSPPSQVLASLRSMISATFFFSFRGFHTPVHFRCGSLFRRPEASVRPVARSPALPASCLMTFHMANSFHLARTTKLRLALRARARFAGEEKQQRPLAGGLCSLLSN